MRKLGSQLKTKSTLKTGILAIERERVRVKVRERERVGESVRK